MPAIDLSNAIPQVIAEEANASLDDLLAAAVRIEDWQERHAEVLDHVYRQRLIRLIRTQAGEAEFQALLEHLDRLTHPRRAEKLDRLKKPYARRWQAYMDLIESRLAVLNSDAAGEVLDRAHVREILDYIGPGGSVSRKELKERFGLREANLTRLLNLMEANELIDTRKIGREIHLARGPAAEHLGAGAAAPASPAARGSSYFTPAYA